eukprot:5101976-Pleurochrysis_carterae.AAC.1
MYAQDGYVSRYLIVPLCLGQLRSDAPRKFRVSVHSSQPIAMTSTPTDAATLARAILSLAVDTVRKRARTHARAH